MFRSLIILFLAAFSVAVLADDSVSTIDCGKSQSGSKLYKVLNDDDTTWVCVPNDPPFPCKQNQYWSNEGQQCVSKTSVKKMKLIPKLVLDRRASKPGIEQRAYREQSCADDMETIGYAVNEKNETSWVCTPMSAAKKKKLADAEYRAKEQETADKEHSGTAPDGDRD